MEDFVLDGKDYKLVTEASIKGNDYLYLAEIEDDDITGNFYVYMKNDEGYKKVTDPDELKKILLVFTANLI